MGDLLGSIGALQLIPENASRTIRLEALAHVTAESSNWVRDKPLISRSRLTRLCNTSLLAGEVASAEDPSDNCFVEDFLFYGGAYLVCSGTTDQAAYTLARLTEAVFQQTKWSHPTHQQNAHDATRAMLAVSDAVARRARLTRNLQPDTSSRSDVEVPFAKHLNFLKSAVTFKLSDLREILQAHHLEPAALEPFIASGPYGSELSPSPHEEGWLTRKPLVQVDSETFVLAVPGLILPAIRHFLIRSTQAAGDTTQLSTCYCDAVWNNVRRNLDMAQWAEKSLVIPEIGLEENHSASFFMFDTDKLAYVQVITDDLRDYDSLVFGQWSGQDTMDQMLTAAQAAEIFGYGLSSPPNEIFHVLLFDSPGRFTVMGLPNNHGLHSRIVLLAASDLESITLLEQGNPLALWQYAGASERARETSKVFAIGQLAEYDLYRRNHSYYFSDDAKPNAIIAEPGGAGSIRREIQRKRDWHGVSDFDYTGIVEVTRVEDDPGIPIYTSPDYRGKRVCFLVELGVGPLWISSPTNLATELRPPYFQVVETLAYWLWQSSGMLEPLLKATQIWPLRVQVILKDVDHWVELAQEVIGNSSSGEPVAQYRLEDGTVELTVTQTFLRASYAHDNSGERELLKVVLTAFNSLAAQHDQEASWTESQIDEFIQEVAPLGLKKKLLVLDSSLNPQVDPQDLPPLRKIQDQDDDGLLDELGLYLTQIKVLPNGPIADDSRTTVLKDVVSFFFSKLQQEIQSLSHETLLDWLIAHNEAIVREVAYRRLTTPTKLECYGRQEEFMDSLQAETPRLNSTILASRFLIEYVAAQPPDGIRAISLSAYDNLLAIASQIINWATESDLIRYEIADVKLSILPSGRLGGDREDYLEKRDLYLASYLSSDVEKAIVSFPSSWRQREGDESDLSPDSTSINQAFNDEFGFSFTELTTFLGELMNIGLGHATPVKKRRRGDLLTIMSASLDWDDERTSKALDLFSIAPRHDFLVPPPPFVKEEVYPWRFNRQLSLMRRPVVVTGPGDGDMVLWGNRQIDASAHNLLNTFWTGRLRAEGQEMKAIISRIRKTVTDEFAHNVALAFTGLSELAVRERFRKVKKKIIGHPHSNLGDVDILVANPDRRRLLLVEAKDLGVGRTPFELSNELRQLVLGSRHEPSMIERHRRRHEWIQDNLEDVLATVGIMLEGDWQVEAIIVVDEDLMTPYLRETQLRVLSLRDLRAHFLPGWLN